MNITYVARHGQNDSNDDEGAIAYALEQLGHKVTCIHESKGRLAFRHPGDFLLFHKWNNVVGMKQSGMPRVFWFFDLVEHHDKDLASRCKSRKDWMRMAMQQVILGFCTDGGWVANDTTRKLIKLEQGVDERILGHKSSSEDRIPILFTGITKGGGETRISFVETMAQKYGKKFVQVESGVYRQKLADLVGRADIVVAPDGPITDSYWSNRVYLMLGLGAFLLHPHCKDLEQHYKDGVELVYYRNRDELHSKIAYYQERPEQREQIRLAGLARTKAEHTYRHRCTKLLEAVEEKLKYERRH